MTRRALLLSALETRRHRTPAPLAPDAQTHSWPSFLGPTHNATSSETRLRRRLPPPLLWEFSKGSGYSSPAIVPGHLVFFHRLDSREIVECLHPETGAPLWRFAYPSTFEDRYGYNNGPRSSPVIGDSCVYTLGAQGKLHCLDLATGKLRFARDLHHDYKVPQDFFGVASTPLLFENRLILNIGAPAGPCVVALDPATGRELWRASHQGWGPSYASPIPALIHSQPRVFVFAGGESNPPTGGLLCLHPATGKIDFAFPWRSRSYESVNASCPVIFDNKVFISASYRAGGALLEILPDFTPRTLFTTSDFGLHFNTPVYRSHCLYGFDGRNEPDASLACLDTRSSRILWRESLEWTETFELAGERRSQTMSPYRGSLLFADGHFLCLGEFGHLLWLDLSPKGCRVLSRAWLFAARESWATPVLSRGLLYLTQNTRDIINGSSPRLLCYDLRA